MLRSLFSLAVALGMVVPLSAGEMDNDTSAKKTTVPVVSKQAVDSNSTASELDSESPTQSWRRYGWGGWGRSYYRGGWGWRGGYGWGGGYRPYYGGWGWGGYYRPYYGGWGINIGYSRPWGGYWGGYGWGGGYCW